MGLSKTGALASLLFILAMATCAHAYSIEINSGDSVTNDPVVDLAWDAPDAYWTSFSCDGTNWTSWQVFPSNSRTFDLEGEAGAGCSAGSGVKAVYFRASEFDNTPLLQVIDNTDSGFYTYGRGGGFTTSGSGSGYYGTNYTYSSPSAGNRARWRFTPPAAGDYEVFGWWPANSANATNSRFRVSHDDGGGATVNTNVIRDQQAEGNEWVSFGTYHYLNRQYQVFMSDAGRNGLVVADAVGIDMPAVDTIVLDSGEPNSTITDPAPLQVIYGTDFPYTIMGTANNGQAGIVGVDVRITKVGESQGAWQDATGAPNWSYSWNNPGVDGQYTIESMAEDGAGNFETAYGSVTVTVETNPPSSLSIAIEDGSLVTTNPVVNLALAADDANEMQFSCDNAHWTPWEPLAATRTFNLESEAGAGCAAGDGVKAVWFRARDIEGKVSYAPIVVDNTDAGFSHSGFTNATRFFGFFGSNYRQAPRVAGAEWAEWDFSVPSARDYDVYARWSSAANRPADAPLTINYEGGSDTVNVDQEQHGGKWNLLGNYPFGDGSYSVRVENTVNGRIVADAILVGEAAEDDIVLDRLPPANTSIVINNGDAYTNNPDVTLTLNADEPFGPVEMRFSCSGGSWTGWENYSATRAFNLESEAGAGCAAGDSVKTVYFEARDTAGLVSADMDSIILDRGEPVSAITAPADGSYVNNAAFPYAVAGTAVNGDSGVGLVQVRFNGGSWIDAVGTAAWTYDWAYPAAGDGSYFIESRAQDGAGNWETSYPFVNVTVDTAPPHVLGISINNGAMVTNDPEVTLSLVGEDNYAMGEMGFSCTGNPGEWTAWEAFAATRAFNLESEAGAGCAAGDGTKYVYMRATDAAGNMSPGVVGDDIELDSSIPYNLGIVINGGDAYTKEGVVELALFAEDNDGLGKMQFSCDNANWTAEVPYSTTAAFDATEPAYGCSPGDGVKEVYFRVYDIAGNPGGPAMDDIILDTERPTVNSFEIEAGAPYTGTGNVTLNLDIADNYVVDVVKFSCTGNAGEWTGWMPYAPTILFDLIGGPGCTGNEGAKEVHMRARDGARNVRRGANDDIVLDLSPPFNQAITINGGDAYTNNPLVDLGLYAEDEYSVVSEMGFSCTGNPGEWTAWEPYATTATFNLESEAGAGCAAGDGAKAVYFRTRDAVGNEAGGIFDTIILDTQGPTGLTITINGGDLYTNDVLASLALSATDNYAMGEMQFSCDGASWTALEPYSAFRANYDLAAEPLAGCTIGDGTKTVYFNATDAAGNPSAGPPVFDTIILDRAGPTSYIYDPFNEQVLTIYNFPYLVHGIADDNASGIASVEFRERGGIWQPASGTDNWTFTWGQQEEGIYVLDSRATDNAGNVQADFNAVTVYVGVSPPTDMNIVINGGAEYTTIADVMLTLQAMNAKDMRFSCAANPLVPDDDTIPWTNWIPFNSPQQFDLEYGLNGYTAGCTLGMNPVPKIVYFQARTNMGVKSAIISDTITLDRIAPNDLNIFINGNAPDTNEVVVSVEVDANGVGEFALSCTSAGPWTPWYAFTSHPVIREFTLTGAQYGCIDGDGAKEVWMRARDFAQGTIASAVFDTINLDRAEPDSGITNLTDGNYLNENDFPNFVIEGDSRDNTGGSGIARVDIRFIQGSSVSPWYPITPLGDGTWDYTWGYPGEGVWTIETMGWDNAGNFEKSISSVSVTIDTNEPLAPTIFIDNNAFATNDANVMLTLSAPDAVEMAFSCDTFTWTTPEPFATTKAFNLEVGDIAGGEIAGCNLGDGIKTVYFMAWDGAGNNSDSPFPQDDIILDTTRPFSAITQPINGAVIGPATMPYDITGTSTDMGGSGVERVEVRITPMGGTPGSWTTAANTGPWTHPWGPAADGNYIIERRAVDRAGNYEDVVQDVNVRVGVVPLTPEIVIDDHNAFTNDVIVRLGLAVSGPTPAENMRFSCDNANWTPWEVFSSARDFNIVAEPLAGCTDVDGAKAVYFQASNFIGNSVVVSDDIVLDRTPPAGLAIVINGGDAFTNSGSATLTLGGTDVNRMSFSCNNSSWTAWEPFSASRAFDLEAEPSAECTAGDGNKAVFYRALDRAENLSGIMMDDIELDMGEPDSDITDPAEGNYLTALPFIVRGTASNGASGISLVQVRFNGGSWIDATGTAAWTYVWGAAADGNYYIESKALDGAGNWETAIEGVNVVLDTIPPQNPGIVIDGNAPYTADRDVTLTLYAEDASHMQFSCDNATWTAKEPYATTRAFDLEAEAGANCTTGDGLKRVYFRGVDLANRTSIVVWDDITLDRGEPDSDITAPFNGADLNAMAFPYTITGVAADTWSGIGLVQVRFNGGSWIDATGTTAWTYNWAYPAAGDGSYFIESRAQDGAGNWETSIENITVNVDTLPPQSMSIMINDNNDYANSADTVLTLSAVGASTMEFSCNNTVWTAPVPYNTNAPFNVNTGAGCSVGDGPKTVFFRATDAAGNSAVVSDGINLDTAAPTGLSVTINSGDIFTNDPNATLGIVVTGASHMQFSCDNATWNGWEAVAASRGFDLVAEAGAGCTGTDGNKAVYFMARDLARNVAGPVMDDIELDRGEPDSDITNLVDGNSLNAGDFPYTITGTAVNGASGITVVQIRFNGGAWADAVGTATWNYSWAAPADGTYLIETRAQDGAGNWETTIEGVTVTVDNTPPTGLSVLINNGDVWTNNADTALTVGAAGADEMQFSCDNASWTAWEAFSVTRAFNVESEAGAGCTVGDGTKTVYFMARDNAGNLSAGSVNDDIGLDTVNPAAGAVSPLNGSATSDRRPAIMINFDDVDSGIDTAASTLYIDGVAVSADVNSLGAGFTPTSDLFVGDHDINMHIYDNAGNLLNEYWMFTVSLTTNNLSVQGITAPAAEAYGNAVNITVDVENEGLVTETGVVVRLYANDVQVDSGTIPAINAGQVIPVPLSWGSADTEGIVELLVAIEPVTGEIVVSDNNAIRNVEILADHDILVDNGVWGTGNTIFLYDTVNVSADVTNNGDVNENVTVELLAYHMSTGWVVADSTTIAVANGATENVAFSWGADRKNYNTLIIRALPAGGETNTVDNEVQSTLRIWSIVDYIELEWFSGSDHPPANTTAGTNIYSMFWVKNFRQNVEDFDAVPITLSVNGAFTVANSMACGAAPGCTIDVAFMDDEYYWWGFSIDAAGAYTVTITAGSDPADQVTITRGVNVA